MRGYSFGKASAPVPYTDAGEIDKAKGYVVLKTRVRVALLVPPEMFVEGHDLPGEFEPRVRKAIAESLVGLDSDGFVVGYIAVEQFKEAGG